ncbi:MAG: DNRLRE domain-containing protein [Planctomycetota bacterium]|nr:DNRLRE domain-containing protein [Planctomycetota bacterium]
MKSCFRSLLAPVMLAALCSLGLFTSFVHGEIVAIIPSIDNSIFSESSNSNALGSLFAGQNSSGQIRRGLLQFDIAGSIPTGATINSVSLGLFQLSRGGGATAENFQLHRLLSSWGEGTSLGIGGGGSGAIATLGDATWNDRFFSTDPWATPGGDFGAISGTATIGTAINTLYTFASQPGLVTDVQNWLNSPTTNFGWLLRASSESTPSNARSFASSENTNSSQRPTLTIDYTAVPEPGSLALVVAAVAGIFFRRYGRLRRMRMTLNASNTKSPFS